MTVVEDEVSLMLDARDVALFPDGTLALTPDTWRLIRVFEGPAANGTYLSSSCRRIAQLGRVVPNLSIAGNAKNQVRVFVGATEELLGTSTRETLLEHTEKRRGLCEEDGMEGSHAPSLLMRCSSSMF